MILLTAFSDSFYHKVAAAAAEGVDDDCNEIVSGVGDNVCDSEVSNLGGFLALAGECDQAASNSSEVSNTKWPHILCDIGANKLQDSE